MSRALTDLTAATAANSSDLLYTVQDPTGAKNDRSITLATLFGKLPGSVAMKGPDPWFDVMAYGAYNDGTNAATTTAAINSAIVAANAVSAATSIGATVFFPAGQYAVNAQLTSPTNGIRLLGAGGIYWPGGQSGVSVLKFSLTNTSMFDLGNATSSNLTFQGLGICGSGGTNLSNYGIFATSVSNIWIIDCNFQSWGSSAVRLNAGQNKALIRCQNTSCLLGYASLSSQQGAIHLGGTENYLSDCNLNGVIGASTVQGAGSQYFCAVYLGGIGRYTNTVAAQAEVGWYINTGGGTESFFTNCRGEFNRADGFQVVSGENGFVNCSAQGNSCASNGTYGGFYVTSGINRFDNIEVNGLSGSANKSGYGIKDAQNNGGGAANYFRSNYYGKVSILNMAAGAIPIYFSGNSPVVVEPNQTLQVISVAPAATPNVFDGQGGCHWQLTITAGATNTTTFTTKNLIPGHTYSLEVINSSGNAQTINLPSNLKSVGYTSPATGNRKTMLLRSDQTLASGGATNIYLIGAVSADY